MSKRSPLRKPKQSQRGEESNAACPILPAGLQHSQILFVCLGNICRSPAAEGLFRALAPVTRCDSAGTAGFHVGEPPYGAMQQALSRRGVDVSELRARQFTPADFEDFGLILAMDRENLRAIEAQRPKGNLVPVFLFTDFAPEAGMDHVPDPYYTRDFEGCLDLLEQAAAGLFQALEQCRPAQ